MATVDSKRGQVPIWPILRTDSEKLCAAIRKGEHDAYVTDLCESEAAGEARRDVIAACKGRGAKPRKGYGA